MTLEQLEQVGPAEYAAAWQKSLADPGNVTDRELAIIGFWDRSRGERATAAREKARGSVRETPAATSTPPQTPAELPMIRKGESFADYCERTAALPATMEIIGVLWTCLTAMRDFAESMNDKNRERNARLDALEARPIVKDAGVWRPDVLYAAGDIVSHSGSGWICSAAHCSTGTEPSHDCFRLFVKAGRDARR
jgi:hypothetical protein